ncbi:MAG: PEP-CTERM sorting domain-containing protein [Fimbriimonadaceae bacterium]
MLNSISIRTITPVAFLALATITSAYQNYEVINIGTLPGSDYSLVSAINNNNVIVGTSYAGPTTRGWYWREDVGMNQIHFGNQINTTAHDINDFDHVVGSFTEGSTTKGFRYNYGAWWYNSPIPGQSESSTRGINNLFQSVGFSDFANQARATGWLPILPDTPGFALPNYGNQESSGAFRINDSGDSVGNARLAGTIRASIFKNNNSIFDLHGLMPQGTNFSNAFDINQAGWVVGEARKQNGFTDAFVFNLELGMQIIPGADPSQSAQFNAINDNGMAVGAMNQNTASLASIWTSQYGLADLNTLIDPNSGWTLTSAEDVNNSGWIVGQGTFNGVLSTYLARPTDAVPEPASMTILALGIGTLIARKRKKS